MFFIRFIIWQHVSIICRPLFVFLILIKTNSRNLSIY